MTVGLMQRCLCHFRGALMHCYSDTQRDMRTSASSQHMHVFCFDFALNEFLLVDEIRL